jgi:hypothetical protein
MFARSMTDDLKRVGRTDTAQNSYLDFLFVSTVC